MSIDKPMATRPGRKYRTITGVHYDGHKMFDGWDAVIQSNGRRFRVISAEVVWKYGAQRKIKIEYLDRREGRKRLKAVRQYKADRIRGIYRVCAAFDVITGYTG